MVKKVLKKVLPEKLIWWLNKTFPSKPFMWDISRNERIIEYAWALRNLPDQGLILDIGSSGSMFSHQLASLGYNVIGLDLIKRNTSHPNLKLIKSNIVDFQYEDKFDAITCISTLEHIALDREAEKKALAKMLTLVKPDGVILITVPTGKPKMLSGHKVYAPDYFGEAEYFVSLEKGVWIPASKRMIENTEMFNKEEVNGIQCVKYQS